MLPTGYYGNPAHSANRGSAFVLVPAKVFDEHLLHRLVIGDKDVADGTSADDMTNLFRQVLGMVARTLERLRHENNLQARLAMQLFGIFDVAQKDQVS